MNFIWGFYLFAVSSLMLSGCITGPGATGNLGYSQDRRVVVVGEKVPKEIAVYYQRRYDAKVWYTPTQSLTAQDVFRLGPSLAMRSLINELKSINYTMGRWEIIVPKVGEAYFLATLKNMETGCLAQARGDVVLTDSKGNKDMEAQLARVTNSNFFVTYEFQKY